MNINVYVPIKYKILFIHILVSLLKVFLKKIFFFC